MRKNIPTKEDFGLYPGKGQDLDRMSAWKAFGGLSLDEVYGVFLDNPLYHQEHLMWMAPKAFSFYLPVALRYLESEDSGDGSDIINILVSDIEFHFTCGEDITPAFPCIQAICDCVLRNRARFNLDADLHQQYENLRLKVCGSGR